MELETRKGWVETLTNEIHSTEDFIKVYNFIKSQNWDMKAEYIALMRELFPEYAPAFDFIAKDEAGNFYVIKEGTGDNLWQEDIDAGYVDYIYYDVYRSLRAARNDEGDGVDGGMILLKEYYGEKTLKDIMSAVEDEYSEGSLKFLEACYGN